ncbi:MAG: acetylornithine transaminase [Oscillospiraceae bacterium]|jgi:acetylornithine/N-succinyldiaminopimelate aminotransferase|nr:acetylornithine transaminase [Oscillospiraceae bacterium]
MKDYLLNNYTRTDAVFVSGDGATLTDENGKRYVDFTSGIGVSSLGYGDKAWTAAVSSQLANIAHTSNLYYNAPNLKLAEKLCVATGYKSVFFSNSGAEANECAIKAARKYSADKYGGGRNVVVTITNSFHGRTLATLAATGQKAFHVHFDPFPKGFTHASGDNAANLEKKLSADNVCAVMFEYIQGEGGVSALDTKFIDALFDVAAKRDIVTIADEVQTGVGRTGAFLCGERYGHKADITTLAKGLGGGLPIGATLFGDKTAAALSPGTHGSTFGGNAAVSAGAAAVIDRVTEDGFYDSVNEKSAYIRQTLLKHRDEIESISGEGLMLGIKLKNKSAADIRKICFDNGLLVLTAKDRIRFLPPLTISRDELEKGLDIFERAIYK